MNTLITDANILIAALIKDGTVRNILKNINLNFIFPEYGISEIYKYKSEIMKKAGISEKEFNISLLRLLKYVKLIPLDIIVPFREEADEIIGKIDIKDTVFIATALAFNCPIWSDDKHFKMQDKIRIFNTREIIEYLKEK